MDHIYTVYSMVSNEPHPAVVAHFTDRADADHYITSQAIALKDMDRNPYWITADTVPDVLGTGVAIDGKHAAMYWWVELVPLNQEL